MVEIEKIVKLKGYFNIAVSPGDPLIKFLAKLLYTGGN